MTNIDDTAPQHSAVSDLSDEELAAAMLVGGEQDDPVPNPLDEVDDGESNDEAPEESVADQIERIKLFDEEYEPDQLKELLSKGKNATQKWQEASELKKQADAQLQEVERLATITKAWDTGDPQVRSLIVHSLAKEAGIDLGAATKQEPQSQAPRIDLDELTDNERAIHEAGQQKIAALEAKLQQVNPLLDKLNKFVEGQTQAQLMDQRAALASAELAQEYGIVAPSLDSIKAAVIETGNPDHKAAWLLKNTKALLDAAKRQGVEQVVKEKPNAPGKSGARTFNPMAKDANGNYLYSGDDAARMRAKGWVPVES